MNFLEKYGVQQRFYTEITQYDTMCLARVIAQYRGKYKIVTEQGEQLAEISGKFRFQVEEQIQYPVVGDYVAVEIKEGMAVIQGILTRKSLFARKAVGISGQVQGVAANIDIVFLCMSLNQNYNLNRMERYLSIAWDSGATPVIVLTKSDLCCDTAKVMQEIERISCFSDILVISMYDTDLKEKFAPYFAKQQTCAFIGSSGVGKSTIMNCLLEKEQLHTQEIGKGDKGKHTTTGRQMFPCPLGGAVIDTPGMREMGVETIDLSQTFAEIEEYQCKFRDCTHTNEPGCAVLDAVAKGLLDQRRLDSYRKLQQESQYDGLTSKQIEVKKCERMFKDVGGIKYARRFAKEKRK